MNHGADSFCRTNASRRPEFIKSESEPILHAETHPKLAFLPVIHFASARWSAGLCVAPPAAG